MKRSRNHFVLIKREGHTRDARPITALDSATALLAARLWPLWTHTRNRKAIRPGAHLAIYVAGDGGRIVATAVADAVRSWSVELARQYPLMLDGSPEWALCLAQVHVLAVPVIVRTRVHQLSFSGVQTPLKWGVYFMGGCRALSAADFAVLTSL